MNIVRLLTLAQHLEYGVLAHAHFDFGKLNLGGTKENPCGSSGCALGECPKAFPEEWSFQESELHDFVPVINDIGVVKGPQQAFVSAEKFFDITRPEADLLFMPAENPDYLDQDYFIPEDELDEVENEDVMYINKRRLTRAKELATRFQVAVKIREFVHAKSIV